MLGNCQAAARVLYEAHKEIQHIFTIYEIWEKQPWVAYPKTIQI